MPATIVVGGQYGSEGKGKVVALLASRLTSPWLVRCGGPNSGHTVRIDGKDVVLRQVAAGREDTHLWQAAITVLHDALPRLVDASSLGAPASDH